MELKKTCHVVGVLMGGCSLEHEVSLRSGEGVVTALTASGYRPVPITIRKDGQWQIEEGRPLPIFEALSLLQGYGLECIFLALHGPNGEDGRIQGLLDMLGYPYTGSGCAASALAIDKPRAKDVVSAAGVPTAPKQCIPWEEWVDSPKQVVETILDTLGLPVVLKAPSQGSSCGMAIVHERDGIMSAMDDLLPLEGRVMAEAYIKGVEVTCSVLDTILGPGLCGLPVTEIRPQQADYFDYHCKYTPGATQEITPARISDTLTETVQRFAVAAHRALGCSSWSRSDFILADSGPVWLEVNTLPGLTKTSLFPQAAAVVGITYNELIVLLTEDAVARFKRQKEKDSRP